MNSMDNYNQSPFGNEQTGRMGFDENHAGQNILVSKKAKNSLLSISKWVKFLAIVGIVGAVLLIIIGILFMGVGGLVSSSKYGGLGAFIGGFAGFVYILLAALYLYPTIKMLNYANKMKRALYSNRQDYYEEALGNFKSGVTFIGILTIIFLVSYAIGVIGIILLDTIH